MAVERKNECVGAFDPNDPTSSKVFLTTTRLNPNIITDTKLCFAALATCVMLHRLPPWQGHRLLGG